MLLMNDHRSDTLSPSMLETATQPPTPSDLNIYWKSLGAASSQLLSQQSLRIFSQWIGQEVLETLNCLRVKIHSVDTAQERTHVDVDISAAWVSPETLQAHQYRTRTIALYAGDRLWGQLTACFGLNENLSSLTLQYLHQIGLQLMLAHKQELNTQSGLI